jgi:hypothetical protein
VLCFILMALAPKRRVTKKKSATSHRVGSGDDVI